MATTVRELLVEFGVQTNEKAMQRITSGIKNVRSGMRNLAKAAAATGAALATVGGALVANAAATSEHAATVLESADNMGLTAQSLQELTFAIEKFGGDQSDLVDMFATISDRAQDAKDGMQSFQDDFALVGVEVDELRGKNPEELFELFIASAQNVEDPTRRVAAAVRIFGDDLGRKLLPMIRRGSEGVAEFRREAQEAGVVMGRDSLEQARDFRFSLFQLRQTFDGLRRTLGSEMIPVLERLITRFQDWVNANSDLIKQRLASFAQKASEGFLAVVSAVERIDKQVQKAGGWEKNIKRFTKAALALGGAWTGVNIAKILLGIGNMVIGIVGFLPSLISGFSTAAAVIGGLSAGTIGIILAGIVGIAAQLFVIFLILEDLFVFLRGGDSLIGVLIQRFREWFQSVESLQRAFDAVATIATFAFNTIWSVGQTVFGLLMAVAKTTFTIYKTVFLTIFTIVSGVFRAIWAIVGPILGLIWVLGKAAFMAIAAVLMWVWSNVILPVVTAIGSMFGWLFGVVRSVVTTIGSIIRRIFGDLFGWIIPLLETVGGWIESLSGWLATLLGVDVPAAADKVEGAADSAQEAGPGGGQQAVGPGGQRRSGRAAAGGGGRGLSGAGLGGGGPAAPIGGQRTGGGGGDMGLGGGGPARGAAGPAAPAATMAAGGPSPSDLAPGGGAGGVGGGGDTFNIETGDMNLTIEVPPDASEERIRDLVSEEFEDHREREKKEIRQSMVRGGEQ